jgi:hypothetical protein
VEKTSSRIRKSQFNAASRHWSQRAGLKMPVQRTVIHRGGRKPNNCKNNFRERSLSSGEKQKLQQKITWPGASLSANCESGIEFNYAHPAPREK